MANLIESNKKLIEQTQNQHLQESVQVNSITKLSKSEDNRIKTITIHKDASGFGFNVRGQISSKFQISRNPSIGCFPAKSILLNYTCKDIVTCRPLVLHPRVSKPTNQLVLSSRSYRISGVIYVFN